jgi:hypothetical protein
MRESVSGHSYAPNALWAFSSEVDASSREENAVK